MLDQFKLALNSTRFWCVVIAALAIYLKDTGSISEPTMILITTILGGYISLRTLNKFEK